MRASDFGIFNLDCQWVVGPVVLERLDRHEIKFFLVDLDYSFFLFELVDVKLEHRFVVKKSFNIFFGEEGFVVELEVGHDFYFLVRKPFYTVTPKLAN